MLNKLVVSLAAAAILAAGAVVGAIAADNKGPTEITLGASGKKPAVFPHAAHQARGFSCGECHHGMSADGKQTSYIDGMTIQKCETCHNPEKLAGKTKGANKLDTLQGAGHGKCQECHKAESKKDPTKANLAKCTTCHSKK